MLTNSNIPEIRDAVNVVSYFSKDEQMRIDAFEREMAILDHAAELAAAKKEGLEEGRDKGKAEDIRAVMESFNKTADEAMDILRISPEERNRLRELF